MFWRVCILLRICSVGGDVHSPVWRVSVGKVLEQLQPGALGTMLEAELRTGKGAQEKYMIKQVECIEQHQANEALKEAMDLLKLRHSNICTYKEMFLTWDNKVVQRFLGQMVDALFYIHRQNIWHRDLTYFPFIKECLTLVGGTSVKLEKSLPPTITDLLLEGDIENVLEFMQASWDIEEVQAKGIQLLASFVKDYSAFPYLLKFTKVITFAMKTHVTSLKLQVDGCRLLLEILNQEVAAENLRKVGIIPDLLSILRRFLCNEEICFSCCGVLWSLAVSGCLTDNDYEPTTALLLDALRMNPERAVLVKNGSLALASLLRVSEIAALTFITDSKGSGINLIKDVYHLHFNDPGVVGAVCLLMKEMVQYDPSSPCAPLAPALVAVVPYPSMILFIDIADDVVLDMLSQKMDQLLSEIKIQFPFSTEIMTLVDATLVKLQK
ncbi:serine/threonine kinase-like domain-containing protein STKLD1 isoform X4 [Willisornis vidua]|uniref:non-specific serine/threonine protein kinase n=1 Tax=Willisornis vidua TaxID=1566151 RepID=A0ABQ9CTF3_9PASS|nr:serine/threonine kinase-like domain-containing protein STKLD1 isoform X4 [Willisornis vidua]